MDGVVPHIYSVAYAICGGVFGVMFLQQLGIGYNYDYDMNDCGLG